MIAELATIAPVFALTIDVVGKAVPHGKAVRKVSAQGSTAVTETTTAVASAGTPLLPATGTVIIRDGPSLSGRSRVSAKRIGVGIRLTPPSGWRLRGCSGCRHVRARPCVCVAPRWQDGDLVERVADEVAHRCRGLAAEMYSIGREPARWHARADRRPIGQHQLGILAAAQHRIALAEALRVSRSTGLAIGEPDDVGDALPTGLGDHDVDCRADTELARRRIVVAGRNHKSAVILPGPSAQHGDRIRGGRARRNTAAGRDQAPATCSVEDERMPRSQCCTARGAVRLGQPVEHGVADQQRLHRCRRRSCHRRRRGQRGSADHCGNNDTCHVLKKTTGHGAERHQSNATSARAMQVGEGCSMQRAPRSA